MYRIGEIKLKISEDKSVIPGRIEKKLGKSLAGARISEWKIVRESLDARKKDEIRWVYTVDFSLDKDVALNLPEAKETKYELPMSGSEKLSNRPVVCGFGPAGMFCGLILAEAGYRPIIIERGKKAEERAKDVERFWETGVLNPESNVQFGEGGAGTFSDGKLTTGIKDPRISKLLSEFALHGADEDILYKQKPHIGTDVLRVVVAEIRKKIIELGGEVMFSTRLDEIEMENGRVKGVHVTLGGARRKVYLPADAVVLAIGHSARDTFRMLNDSGIEMLRKPFSIGVRIEHPQKLIDISQYGAPHEELGLPPAEYKLNCRVSDDRGVYTFCMCPGGEVISASSQHGGLVTNGMSYRDRGGEFANSALLVDLRPSDFESDSPMAGIVFQEKYEKLAFENGGRRYKAPTAKTSDFYEGNEAGKAVINSLPEFAVTAIKEALPILGRKLKGFDSPDAVMRAVEARSSSPVRITRNENYESVSVSGLYPAGEGAGYAGGIMSAAVDGIRIAEEIIKKYKI
ncbi:MAG: NAD(FAD)-utilizing dehydrogenase [Firmicutes bacterium]|nr:NAD(FAD)-utilizing dehydrogenase [Bacillota bacterium]